MIFSAIVLLLSLSGAIHAAVNETARAAPRAHITTTPALIPRTEKVGECPNQLKFHRTINGVNLVVCRSACPTGYWTTHLYCVKSGENYPRERRHMQSARDACYHTERRNGQVCEEVCLNEGRPNGYRAYDGWCLNHKSFPAKPKEKCPIGSARTNQILDKYMHMFNENHFCLAGRVYPRAERPCDGGKCRSNEERKVTKERASILTTETCYCRQLCPSGSVGYDKSICVN